MGAAPNQLNVEYFFRLIYDCFTGACTISGYAALLAFFAHLWLWITIVGYLFAFAGIAFIVYCSMRLFQLRHAEEEKYGHIHLAKEEPEKNPRWAHIEELMGSDTPSAWREAILEADIMLADALARRGYQGDSLADQLQQLTPQDFASLDDAWEAHRVRNEIAHAGSAFGLSRTLAQRTIARYERFFEEFGVL